MATINFTGTGGIIEGNLGAANVDVNLDAVHTFDGTDDYLTATSSKGDIEWSGTAFSITAWVYMTDSGKNVIASLVPSTSSNDGAVLIIDEDDSNHFNSIALSFKEYGTSSNDNTAGVTAAAKLHTNVWHHITVTYNGGGSGTIGNYNFYIDGALFETGKALTAGDFSGRTDTLTANKVYIGRDKTEYFAGNLADVRIYDDVLTATEVGEIASKINYESSGADNLIGRWKIAGSSIDLTDSSANSNNATASGSPATKYDAFSVNVHDNSTTTDGTFTVTQGKVEGKALTSVNLDGTGDHIVLANNNIETKLRTSHTFSGWFKAVDGIDAANQLLIGQNSSDGGDRILIYIGGTGKLTWLYNANGTNVYAEAASANIGNGQTPWHHFVASMKYNSSSSATMKLYLDGVEVVLGSSSSINGAFGGNMADYDSTHPLMFGAENNGGGDRYNFEGNLRDFKFYDYDLSSDQAASLYSGSYNVTPYHWYKMDDGSTTTASDTGTATAVDATLTEFSSTAGSVSTASDWNNGTLNLDSTLTIEANGTLSAPRGIIQVNGDFSNSSTIADANGNYGFTHNSGTYENTASGENILHTGVTTTFATLDSDVRFIIDTDINVETAITGSGQIRPNRATSSGGQTFTMGTDTSAADITTGFFGMWGNSCTIKIYAKNQLYPWTMVGALFTGGFGVATGEVYKLKWGNISGTITTKGTYSNDATMTLDGDMEFDAVTVSAGDTLDFNGQRMEMSGTLSNLGTLDADGQIYFTGSGTMDDDNTINNLNLLTLVQQGTSTATMDLPNTNVINTLFYNQPSVTLPNPTSLRMGINHIIGAGTMTYDTGTPSTTNLTIATGATLLAGSSTTTVAGDFTTSGGLIGKSALDFDGVNDYVDLSNDSDWQFGTSNFTLEAWFRSDDGSGNRTIIANGDASDNGFLLYMQSSGNIKFFVNNIALANASPNYEDSKWHHVAAVRDGNDYLLYIDGKLMDKSTQSAQNLTHAGKASIGARDISASADAYWDGQIGMVRVFNDARTQAELRADMFNDHASMANAGNLVAMYQFDEGTGSTVDNIETDDDLDGTISSASWAGAGTFTHGTSNLTMTGTSKKINYTGEETVYDLTINGTVTLNEIAGNNDGFMPKGDFTVGASKTLSSTSTEGIVITDNSNTAITIGSPATSIAGLYKLRFRQSGSINLPACTTPRVFLEVGTGNIVVATGDITVTQELEVGSGLTFNANGNTIAVKAMDLNSGGTLDLSNSEMNFSLTTDGDNIDLASGSTLLTGNTTLTGNTSSQTTAIIPAAGNFEVVGDVSHFYMLSGGDLTVIGSVSNNTYQDSTANIRQWHHTLDTQQLLDADSAGDDDLRLSKPALDNSHELQTG